MIVLDTNVISELMRLHPNAAVAVWVGRQPLASLFTTSITKAEILYGIAVMPDGRRKSSLATGAERMFRTYFASRTLAFGDSAAACYAALRSARRSAGRPMQPLDGQIAAIALAAGAALATRNTDDFDSCGLTLVNPWSAA